MRARGAYFVPWLVALFVIALMSVDRNRADDAVRAQIADIHIAALRARRENVNARKDMTLRIWAQCVELHRRRP